MKEHEELLQEVCRESAFCRQVVERRLEVTLSFFMLLLSLMYSVRHEDIVICLALTENVFSSSSWTLDVLRVLLFQRLFHSQIPDIKSGSRRRPGSHGVIDSRDRLEIE